MLNHRPRKELRLMARINETDLQEGCGHRGTLEYVKLFRTTNPLPGVPFEGVEEILIYELAQSAVPLVTWIHPDFCTRGPLWRIVLWVGVNVDGEECVAAMSIRNAESLHEQHILVEHPRQNRSVLAIGLHNRLELTYDREGDVFFPVPLELGPDVFSTVTSIKTYLH
jgi:hypothetical protein